MNNIKNLLVGLVLVVVLMGGAWYLFVKEKEVKPRPIPPTFNFSQEGRLEKDGEGMQKGKWYLSYTEGGQSKSLLLKFVDFSTCSLNGVGEECDDDTFKKGMPINLQGIREGDSITVTYLIAL